MNRLRTLIVVVAALLPLGCGGKGPVDSGPIALTINSINDSDFLNATTVAKDKNVGTETGNPWGEFIDLAQLTCEADPVGFEVLTVSISIDPGSNAAAFEEVLNGATAVYFSDNSSSDVNATVVDVATVDQPTGAGPITMTVVATRSTLGRILARLVGGDFHIGFRGATSLTPNDQFSIDVRVSLTARAFCD